MATASHTLSSPPSTANHPLQTSSPNKSVNRRSPSPSEEGELETAESQPAESEADGPVDVSFYRLPVWNRKVAEVSGYSGAAECESCGEPIGNDYFLDLGFDDQFCGSCLGDRKKWTLEARVQPRIAPQISSAISLRNLPMAKVDKEVYKAALGSNDHIINNKVLREIRRTFRTVTVREGHPDDGKWIQEDIQAFYLAKRQKADFINAIHDTARHELAQSESEQSEESAQAFMEEPTAASQGSAANTDISQESFDPAAELSCRGCHEYTVPGNRVVPFASAKVPWRAQDRLAEFTKILKKSKVSKEDEAVFNAWSQSRPRNINGYARAILSDPRSWIVNPHPQTVNTASSPEPDPDSDSESSSNSSSNSDNNPNPDNPDTDSDSGSVINEEDKSNSACESCIEEVFKRNIIRWVLDVAEGKVQAPLDDTDDDEDADAVTTAQGSEPFAEQTDEDEDEDDEDDDDEEDEDDEEDDEDDENESEAAYNGAATTGQGGSGAEDDSSQGPLGIVHSAGYPGAANGTVVEQEEEGDSEESDGEELETDEVGIPVAAPGSGSQSESSEEDSSEEETE